MKYNNKINAEEIKKLLRHNNLIIEVYNTVDSTNNILKKRIGETEGLTIITDSQSAGKGRKDHSFFSPSGCGIYMSTLLHPQLPTSECTLITVAAAVAACEAIEAALHKYCNLLSAERLPMIKWINDLLCDGKKICGILTEAVFSENGDFGIVLGIGINVFEPQNGYPDEIKSIAGAIFGKDEYQNGIRERIIADTLDRFYDIYENLTAREFIPEYKKRLCVFDRTVTVKPNSDNNYTAVPFDIDRDGRLICRRECDGETVILDSGEISIKL